MADDIANRREITVEVDGRSVTGSYMVWAAGVITVLTGLGMKATQVGSMGAPGALDSLAKRMLRELVQEGNA
jgi:hypothetical protein